MPTDLFLWEKEETTSRKFRPYVPSGRHRREGLHYHATNAHFPMTLSCISISPNSGTLRHVMHTGAELQDDSVETGSVFLPTNPALMSIWRKLSKLGSNFYPPKNFQISVTSSNFVIERTAKMCRLCIRRLLSFAMLSPVLWIASIQCCAVLERRRLDRLSSLVKGKLAPIGSKDSWYVLSPIDHATITSGLVSQWYTEQMSSLGMPMTDADRDLVSHAVYLFARRDDSTLSCFSLVSDDKIYW